MQEFNLHSHTYRCMHSDADMLDEEYVEDYIKMGFKKMAFTDHCPEKNIIDVRPRVRMPYEQKQEYLDSITNLKEKYKGKIEILSGYEVEYLPGEEENIMELKQESDIIVLGQHFIYGNKEKKELKILGKCEYEDKDLTSYAMYIEKAINLGIPDIIAHPDIYLMKRKNFGEIEKKVAHRICKVCEEYKIPLEINLNNIFQRTYNKDRILNNLPLEEQRKRLDTVQYPRKEFWQIASEYNVEVLYGLDAHYRGQIPRWNELVELSNEMIGIETINKLKFIKEWKEKKNNNRTIKKEYMQMLLKSSQKYFIKATRDKELAKKIKKMADY